MFYLLGLHVIFLFGTESVGGGLLRNEINDLKRASRVSGNLAPRVSGRKEVATEPARQISIMIMYGIWAKVQKFSNFICMIIYEIG